MAATLPDNDFNDFTVLPEVGQSVPRRGNALSRGLFRFIMRLLGWRIVGRFPNLPRFVLIGAPHTSNADFFIGALTMASLGIDVHLVMKHTVFVGPIGRFLRWFGAISLDRHRTRDFVSQMVDEFDRRERFMLALMPEGKRAVPKEWRSGFYYIAKGAGVPIVLVGLDYKNRRLRIGPTFWASGDYAADLPVIQAYFSGYSGRRADRTMDLRQSLKEPA